MWVRLVAGTRELSYLTSKFSMRQVAAFSGIPRTTLRRAMSGELRLPTQYRPQLRNLYQRTVYGAVREAGMSVDQSRRFSWRSPETAFITEGRMISLVDEMALGNVSRRAALEDVDLWSPRFNEIWDEEVEAVKEALRCSERSIEEWEAYVA